MNNHGVAVEYPSATDSFGNQNNWLNHPIFRDSIVTRSEASVGTNSSSENQNTFIPQENLVPLAVGGTTNDSSLEEIASNQNDQRRLEDLTPLPVTATGEFPELTESTERRLEIPNVASHEQAQNLPSSLNSNEIINPANIPTSYETSSNGRRKSRVRRISSHVPVISGEGGVLERLFGETKARGFFSKGVIGRRGSSNSGIDLSRKILMRQPVRMPTIEHYAFVGKWVVDFGSITSSFDTEIEARAASRAFAPPKMHPFEQSPKCFVCENKFAVFRRASHCRNCGVCICSNCSVSWPSRMIPKNFNIKNEDKVKICVACDWISHAFREALVSGRQDDAMALNETGNINLRAPFANVKGEVFNPIHAAVLGKNFNSVKWLIEIECCPIHISPTSNTGRISQHLLVTSNGRSVIDIAMDNHDVDILRYLVVERSASIFGYRNMHNALQTLDLVIRTLPRSTTDQSNNATMNIPENSVANHNPVNPTAPQINGSSINCKKVSTTTPFPYNNNDEVSLGDDACIICYDERIDCVLTPCGHQICCTKCSSNLSNCPVCNIDCSFIRTYGP